jgi:hypothetical protein
MGISNVDQSRDAVGAPDRFPAIIRALRRNQFGKQLALALAVGCTEAAVSYWENGKRVPRPGQFPSIADAFCRAGASLAALERLRLEWERARLGSAQCRTAARHPQSRAPGLSQKGGRMSVG